MAKKNSSILLLSAFAALVLAGCNAPSTSSSKAAESSATSVVEESSKEESKASEAPSSPAASSSTPASSSKPAASSSSEPQRNVWEGMAFVGEYKCGEVSLTINDDGTTKWTGETASSPATLTTTAGVHHIVSGAGVAEGSKVDVYTDGTMAYVVRGGVKYIMDKNGAAAGTTAFAANEDDTKMFGGLLLANGSWKYLAKINGTFHFGITLEMILGTNINLGGAIFEVTVDGTKLTFTVTTAASDTLQVAVIEASNLSYSKFTGASGDLVIAKNAADEVTSILLDGTALNGAKLVGDVVSLRTSDAPTYDKNDTGVDLVYQTTTYTLDRTAKTYTAGTGTDREAVFHALSGATGSYSTTVGADGNLWATFSSTIAGVMHVTETTQIPTGGSYGDDTYITVYKASATTDYTKATAYGNAEVVLAEDDGYNPIDSTFDVEANLTYVIKLGAYNDRTKDYTSTASTYAGQTEAMSWVFTANTVDTYTGPNGDLVISKKGEAIASITLNGETLTGYTMDGNNITTVVKTTDVTDLTNVSLTTTTTVITIDPTAHTYTSTATPVTTNPFTTLGATATSFSGATDDTGNTWAAFTPASDGIINVTETSMGSITDSYLAIYDLTALGGDLTKLKSASSNAVAYTDANPAVVSNLTVNGGHTYIIKHGSYYAKDILVGDKTGTASYIGVTMTYSFSYSNLVPTTYTGADGNLVTWFEDGVFHHATLGSATLEGATASEGVITLTGTPTYENTEDTHATEMVRTDTVFTLDQTAHTYVKTTPEVRTNVLNTLTETSTGLSGTLGADLNLWASFTPTEAGFISIDETVQATGGTSKDTLVAVYEEKATGAAWSNYAGYSSNSYPSGSLKALNAESAYSAGADNVTNPVYVHDLPVEAGKTYIIKIGAYGGNSYYPGNSATSSYAAWVGSPEAFSFRFNKIVTGTFAGADGELVVSTLGGNLRSATLAGAAISNDNAAYNAEADTLSVKGAPTYDLTTDPLDPTETRTDKVYTLDRTAGTYTVADTPVVSHLFGEITAGVAFTGTTGKDGCYYAKYTAAADGAIRIKDTVLANSSDYVVVYEAKAGNTAANYRGTTNSGDNNNSVVGYSSCYSANSQTNKLLVEAGKTYIIKVCSYSTSSKYIGGTDADASYQNKTGTIELEYFPYTTVSATGDEGALVVSSLDGSVKKVTLNGVALSNPTVSSDQKTIEVSSSVIDDQGAITTTKKTYTISEDGTTYTVAVDTSSTDPIFTIATEAGEYHTELKTNGLALMMFTAPADGTYKIEASCTSVDNKLGIYTDVECTKLATTTTTNPVDSAMSGGTESVTFNATAGQVFFVKTSYYSDFSRGILSTSTSTKAGAATTFTITKTA